MKHWGQDTTIHKLKVVLRESEPPIWRRLEVPSSITLHQLHDIIQVVFGWENRHAWEITTSANRYGDLTIPDQDEDVQNADSTFLYQAAPHTGERLVYTYDFGDNWVHDVLVESVSIPDPATFYPRCVIGAGTRPPEDSGGSYGYEDFRMALSDPAHDEHEDALRLGQSSAHLAFNLDKINSALAATDSKEAGE